MKARRLGHVFCPIGEWTHASTPTAAYLGGNEIRVFFSSRDRYNRSHICSLDLDLRKPTHPKRIMGPLLSPGPKGAFDDAGVSVSCIWDDKLYYLGWNLGKNAPFHNSIGMAHLGDYGTVQRLGFAPVLGRSEFDPLSVAYPYVIDNRMWYSSNKSWGKTHHDMKFVLTMARTHQHMNRQWVPTGHACMPLPTKVTAMVRPSVMQLDRGGKRYGMWYAIKHQRRGYRIAYAKSTDGGITFAPDTFHMRPGRAGNWDSDELTYPCVFNHRGTTYMLYNGNGYGRTGFGIAVIE